MALSLPADEDRKRAIVEILNVLSNPLRLMCVPDRQRAAHLADVHDISALDLLTAARERARNA